MPNTNPSVRSIARQLGLSKATVANALRGQSNVAPDTARRVRAAAAKAGYRGNPMVASVMSAMRRSHASGFHGVLACLDIAEPDRPEHGPFHRQLMLGAQARAADLGFKLENFVVGPEHLSVARLDSILKARGIQGIVLLPSWRPPHLSEFDWASYSAVFADYAIAPPHLHAVCCGHYRSMLALLDELRTRGYRRPGLFLEIGRDERILLRMSAALHSFQVSHPDCEIVPPLKAATISPAAFFPWFKRYRPDVVLSHHTEVMDMIESLGLHIPADCGFACLNLTKATRRAAGLDQQPGMIGARCAELLIAQLQRNERGVPECPSTLTLPARVVDGPTLRPKRKTSNRVHRPKKN